MASSPLNSVLVSTLQKSRKNLIMASMKSNALMAWAFSNKRVVFEDGGASITNPLTVGRNSTVGSYEYYDSLPMIQTDEFTEVAYNWSRVAGSVMISQQEQDESRGASQIFKLLSAKMDVLKMSFEEQFSTYLYGAGVGKDPNGLALLVPDDPTTGTVGGINRATETQWRTSAYDFNGGLDETNIEEAYDDVLDDLTVKSERPDLIITGRNNWRYLRAAARDKTMFNLNDTKSGGRMFDLGFQGATHNGITIVYDEDCPVNKTYFLNSKYLKLHILRHVNMKVQDLAAPWTIDAVGKRVTWQGQWCLWKAHRTHAVVYN